MEKVKVEKPSKEQLDELGVTDWGIWESEVKKFNWKYDEEEMFYVIDGKVKVTLDGGKEVNFGRGDLVTFAKGVKCVWDVIEPIRKYYKFG
jgi:uncharacterized protein